MKQFDDLFVVFLQLDTSICTRKNAANRKVVVPTTLVCFNEWLPILQMDVCKVYYLKDGTLQELKSTSQKKWEQQSLDDWPNTVYKYN